MLSTCSERVSHCDYHKKKNFFNLKKKNPVPFLALLAGSWDSQFLRGVGGLATPTQPLWGQGEVVTVAYVSLQPSVTTPDSQGALHSKILPVTSSQDGGDAGEGRPGGTSRRAKD